MERQDQKSHSTELAALLKQATQGHSGKIATILIAEKLHRERRLAETEGLATFQPSLITDVIRRGEIPGVSLNDWLTAVIEHEGLTPMPSLELRWHGETHAWNTLFANEMDASFLLDEMVTAMEPHGKAPEWAVAMALVDRVTALARLLAPEKNIEPDIRTATAIWIAGVAAKHPLDQISATALREGVIRSIALDIHNEWIGETGDGESAANKPLIKAVRAEFRKRLGKYM